MIKAVISLLILSLLFLVAGMVYRSERPDCSYPLEDDLAPDVLDLAVIREMEPEQLRELAQRLHNKKSWWALDAYEQEVYNACHDNYRSMTGEALVLQYEITE